MTNNLGKMVTVGTLPYLTTSIRLMVSLRTLKPYILTFMHSGMHIIIVGCLRGSQEIVKENIVALMV